MLLILSSEAAKPMWVRLLSEIVVKPLYYVVFRDTRIKADSIIYYVVIVLRKRYYITYLIAQADCLIDTLREWIG